MRKTLMMLLVLAPYSHATDTLSLKLLSNSPLSSVKAVGSQKDGAFGVGFGVDYLHGLGRYVEVGAEIDELPRSGAVSSSALPNAQTEVDGSDLAVMALVKFRDNAADASPFISLGFGLDQSSLKATGSPAAGFQWANGARDNRTLVDDTQSTYALSIRAGYEALVWKRLQLGAEAGYFKSGSVTHGLTAQGQQALGGSGSVTDAHESIVYGVTAGWRF